MLLRKWCLVGPNFSLHAQLPLVIIPESEQLLWQQGCVMTTTSYHFGSLLLEHLRSVILLEVPQTQLSKLPGSKHPYRSLISKYNTVCFSTSHTHNTLQLRYDFRNADIASISMTQLSLQSSTPWKHGALRINSKYMKCSKC